MAYLDTNKPDTPEDRKINLTAIISVMTSIGAGFLAAAANWQKIEPMTNSPAFIFVGLFLMLTIGFAAGASKTMNSRHIVRSLKENGEWVDRAALPWRNCPVRRS